ncbi:MAG: 4Fe-4S binding protein [Synergistaceae bacterium]|nr:4Fe-4S binding protein [Synergistaceae bacterium]
MKKFEILLNKAWCKGCGLCAGVCPKGALEMGQGAKPGPVLIASCAGCRLCEDICPDLAITVKGGADDAEG